MTLLIFVFFQIFNFNMADASWIDLQSMPAGQQEIGLANVGMVEGSIASALFFPSNSYTVVGKNTTRSLSNLNYTVFTPANIKTDLGEDSSSVQVKSQITPMLIATQKNWSKSALTYYFYNTPQMLSYANLSSTGTTTIYDFNVDSWGESKIEALGLAYAKQYSQTLTWGLSFYLAHQTSKSSNNILHSAQQSPLLRQMLNTRIEHEVYGLGLNLSSSLSVTQKLKISGSIELPGVQILSSGKLYTSQYSVTIDDSNVEDTEAKNRSTTRSRPRHYGNWSYRLGMSYQVSPRFHLYGDSSFSGTRKVLENTVEEGSNISTIEKEVHSVAIATRLDLSSQWSLLGGARMINDRGYSSPHQLTTLGLQYREEDTEYNVALMYQAPYQRGENQWSVVGLSFAMSNIL